MLHNNISSGRHPADQETDSREQGGGGWLRVRQQKPRVTTLMGVKACFGF
jgi:hypothetical protein